MKTKNQKPLSLRIESKLHYLFIIFGTLLIIILFIGINYRNYTYNEGFNFLFFCIALFIIGLIYFLFRTIIKTDFSIKFNEESLTIKRPFNRSITVVYNEINKIDITYGSPLDIISGTPLEMIIISRKSNKSLGVILERWKIDLREHSNFQKCMCFLSDKASVTIHVHNLNKKAFSTVKTKARLEWSDNPNDFYKKYNQQ
ncbi:hypothetical protein ACE193_18655 [Bernardetia sp. OM2101]|uniref:hypothetical protein n=1 Tax=Bernardetia sp. OM2101 TaxID=3344876 RepID=UPI0035D0EB01